MSHDTVADESIADFRFPSLDITLPVPYLPLVFRQTGLNKQYRS